MSDKAEAYWIEDSTDGSCIDSIFCSACGGSALGIPWWECDLVKSRYCPHCGKKMKNPDEDYEDYDFWD